jgi:hypothetical protein
MDSTVVHFSFDTKKRDVYTNIDSLDRGESFMRKLFVLLYGQKKIPMIIDRHNGITRNASRPHGAAILKDKHIYCQYCGHTDGGQKADLQSIPAARARVVSYHCQSAKATAVLRYGSHDARPHKRKVRQKFHSLPLQRAIAPTLA